MDAERFKILAAAYGGDPRRWPLEARQAALAFMDSDMARAERMLFEARQIDAALDASPAPQVSHALRDAVLASAPPARPQRARLFDFRRWAAAAAALACACVVGVAVGAGAVQRVTADVQADAIIADADTAVIDDQEIFG
jgi:hypothetical protein